MLQDGFGAYRFYCWVSRARICFISHRTKQIARTAAAPSAMGPAYITPSIPQRKENSRISGSRKMICLVIEIIMPSFALPMEVKKFDVRGCRPLAKVKNI